MISQTKLQINVGAARKKLNGSVRRNRQFVMNVYKDQYQKFWHVAKAVGVLIYLELKHKIGMRGKMNFIQYQITCWLVFMKFPDSVSTQPLKN